MTRDEDVPEIDGDEALVHALLTEQVGGEVVPDQTARVLARIAERDRVAARVAVAGTAASGTLVPARSPRWLAAAAILLGCSVVAGVLCSRRADAPQPAPIRQPAPQLQDPEILRVDSVARLRELLPSVVGLRVEAWFLPGNIDVDLRSAPAWEADATTLQAV